MRKAVKIGFIGVFCAVIGLAFPVFNIFSKQLSMDSHENRLMTGLPRTFTLSSSEILEALEEVSSAIVEAIHSVLERTPPELASDITENGICLTGGGALLYGMDKFIAEQTKVPCYVAEDPISCVAIGTGKVLENIDAFSSGAIYDYKRGEYFDFPTQQ